ncbi:hypothetical protein Dimus_034418 [Dionaea muscipula]
MTIDDENSIYVGGLPYDCSEDELRRVFELYGSVVAVKIINDRAIGGKCYGFVTFTNPRSAVDAMSDTNVQTIRGRALRVNEVKSRGAGGRSSHSREGFQYSSRGVDRDRGRDRGKDYDNGRDRYGDHSRELERERERERGYDLDHGGRSTAYVQDRDRDQGRDIEESERGHSRNRDREWERDHDLDLDHDEQADRVDYHDRRDEKDKDHRAKRSRSSSYDRRSREFSSELSDYQQDLEEEMRSLNQEREGLIAEKHNLEERLEEKKQLIADLQRKSMKLEGALTSSKKLSSLRHMQLTRLQKSFLQVQQYNERLKSSEKDLQALAESLMIEMDEDEMVA